MPEKKDHVDNAREQWAAVRPELDTSTMGIIARLYRYQFLVDKALVHL